MFYACVQYNLIIFCDIIVLFFLINCMIILQRVERELHIKSAGHIFSGPRNSIVNQSQQQQDPSETETLLPGVLNIDLPGQSTSHGIFFFFHFIRFFHLLEFFNI